ncbi:two-component sensor histidine kinase [Streptomyces cinnamoneus]|uniref:histidine kinase n=1 Tax=Streptomyces cinnamoneus TaxID=53446 RepID=A0A2G1XD73_STRCJ|nr:histidine kinase [Streptomyces cinnamoneus]PHQ49207.1 two-component sensor histidine kinase [Streptomyces cinnamoneus]PPT15143.1 two-component sensor histidine kinase [Streptomyces cinnamoneus]
MPVRFPSRLPDREAVLIAAAGLLGGALLYALGLNNRPEAELPQWLALVALALMAGAELLRRTAPLVGLAVGTGALVVDVCSGSLFANVAMYTDLVYSAVLYGPPEAYRRIPRVTEAVTVVGTLVAVVLIREPVALLIGIGLGVVTVAPAWTGVGVRVHRDAAEAARMAAERTALLAELDRREAVGAERARMARELHDMVAGHLSAIAIHSSAALSINEPEASREALGVIRENSVQGLAEMRRLIGLLRETVGADEPAATPRLDGLDALVAQARRGVRDDRFAFVLSDGRGAGALPAPVELAAYRIVQESLTNVVKHAASGEVTVELRRADAGSGPLTVEVTSPLGDGRAGPRAPGAGAGLVGMRERVALLGGEFEAGPAEGRTGRVWRIRAVLPVDEEETR